MIVCILAKFSTRPAATKAVASMSESRGRQVYARVRDERDVRFVLGGERRVRPVHVAGRVLALRQVVEQPHPGAHEG